MADIAMWYALLQRMATGLEPTTYINLDVVHRSSEADGAVATAVVLPAADDTGLSSSCAYDEAEHGAATRLARNLSSYLGVNVQTTCGSIASS